MIKGSLFQLVLLVLLISTGATGQQVTGSPGRPDSPAERPLAKQASDVREELARMLLDRPPVPITKPRGFKPKPTPSYLPACGTPVIDRRCWIVYRPDTGWYLLTFVPKKRGEAVLPRWVLPSKWLQEAEPIIARTPGTIFRVSGETTVYRDRTFILLRKIMIEPPRKKKANPAVKAQKKTPAVQPAPSEAEPAPPDASAPDAIIRNLMRDRPGKPILVSAERGEVLPAPSVAPSGNVQQLDEDRGNMRIDRLVTIVFDDANEWMEARFESDNTLQDQPIRLLPCYLLEQAESIIAAEKRKYVHMKISGQITHYKKHRYLLLRKVLRQSQLGQF